jgi:hypothetical protein
VIHATATVAETTTRVPTRLYRGGYHLQVHHSLGRIGADTGCGAENSTISPAIRRSSSGTSAITAWKAGASAKYSYTSEPFAVEQRGGRYVVTSRLTGNFPGSPVDLRYTFGLERGKIAFLEIAP